MDPTNMSSNMKKQCEATSNQIKRTKKQKETITWKQN